MKIKHSLKIAFGIFLTAAMLPVGYAIYNAKNSNDSFKTGETLALEDPFSETQVPNIDKNEKVSDTSEPLQFVEFGYWKNNKHTGGAYSQDVYTTTFRFNGTFDSNNDLSYHDAQNYDIANTMFVNGVSVKSLWNEKKAELWWYTGDCGKTYSRCALTFVALRSYFDELMAQGEVKITIAEGSQYRGKTIAATVLACNNGTWSKSSFNFSTQEKVTLKEYEGNINGLCFETRINYKDYGIYNYGNISTLKIGTYLVLKSSYESSSYYGNIANYLANTQPSGTTYVDVPNTYKDFINGDTAKTDGYLAYYGSIINIKDGNFTKDFIPVGYIGTPGNYYYGSTGNFSANLLDTLYANKTNSKAKALLENIIWLKGNSNSYLIENMYSDYTNTITPSLNGSYAVTATRNARMIVIGKQVVKGNVSAGQTRYVLNQFGTFIVQAQSFTLNHGFSEPTRELWSEDLNCSPNDTLANNALVISTFHAKSIRVWLAVGDLLTNVNSWPGIGMISTGTSTNHNKTVEFDATKIATLRNVLQTYRDAGCTEITLLVNGFVYDTDSRIFTGKDGNPTSFWGDKVDADDWRFRGAFPEKYSSGEVTQEYKDFLNENAQYFKLISQNFEGLVDSVETMNEINLRPVDFDVNLRYGGYVSYLNNNGKSLDYNDFLAERSMDYCKAISDALRSVNSKIRVLTPAVSVCGDFENHDFSTGGFDTVTGISFERDGKHYVDACMKYIRDYGNARYMDYFQGLNLHPYMWLTQSKDLDYNGYLYLDGKSPKGNVGFNNLTANVDYNPDYDTDWGNMVEDYHTMLENYGYHNCPFYLTEYGTQDNSNKTGSSLTKWQNWWKNGFIRTVMINIDNQIKARPYITNTYLYRIYDYKEHNGTKEPNFGIIDVNGNIKDQGLAYYYIINGSEYTGNTALITPAE